MTSGTGSKPEEQPGRLRTELRAFGELFALAGLAITQPILDIFGRAPDHLNFRGVGPAAIIAFGLVVTFAVPTIAWLLEIVVGTVSRPARAAVHSIALWALAATALTLLLDTQLNRITALVVGTLLAIVFVILHDLTRGPRIWLAYLSPAPIVFLAIFLFASPVAPLLRSGPGALGSTITDPTRTIVLVFDEFSLPMLLDDDGEIDADLFPNFARLADTSTWFRQTTTVANTTNIAVPAMLTGRVPMTRSTPDAATHPENLFTFAGGSMRVVSAEVITSMCPPSICEQIGTGAGGLAALLGDARETLRQRLDPADPEIDITLTMVDDPDSPAGLIDPGAERNLARASSDGGHGRFEQILESIDEDPSLHLVHLLLPHGPFRFLPDGTLYPHENPQIGRFFDFWVEDEIPVGLLHQRYLLQTQYTDAILGRLIDHLEDHGFWDDTNLVVIADHGIGVTEGGPVRAIRAPEPGADRSMAQILWVPFFVKAAGQHEGMISDDPVRNIDLTATIADLLDTEIPWEQDGVSAFAGGSGDPDETGLHLVNLSEPWTELEVFHRMPRAEGWTYVLERTAASIAPATDGATGSERIYRTGPRPDLWSRPIPPGLEPIDVDVHADSRASGIDPESGRLPALFRATTDVDAGTDVAITIDDTVWATTTVYPRSGANRVDAILPPDAFRAGDNEIRVFRLEPPTPMGNP